MRTTKQSQISFANEVKVALFSKNQLNPISALNLKKFTVFGRIKLKFVLASGNSSLIRDQTLLNLGQIVL